MLNKMLMQIEFKKAVAEVRAESKRNGNSKMSMKEINAIISEVRADAGKERAARLGLTKARGGLRKYANPDLIPFEKEAWEKAAVRKYAKQ